MAPEPDINLTKRNQDNEKVLGRILTFSDGVFAIAILLLLIDIRLPVNVSTTDLGCLLRVSLLLLIHRLDTSFRGIGHAGGRLKK